MGCGNITFWATLCIFLHFSYAYAYQTENSPRARSTTQSTTITTQTTAAPPTTTLKTTTPTPVRQLKPREPKSYFLSRTTVAPKHFKPTPNHFKPNNYHLNEVDVDNKVAEERHDHFYVNRHPHWHHRANPSRARRKIIFPPGPTLATSVISSLKPRFYYPKAPPAPPPPIQRGRKPLPQTRRISHGAGDHRYVSFYRGQVGGPSWGYSYHL